MERGRERIQDSNKANGGMDAYNPEETMHAGTKGQILG